jgi:hypothetical protein
MSSPQKRLAELEHGLVRRFSAWPDTDCPCVAAGAYTIWRGSRLLYVGMSDRGLTRSRLATARRLGRPAGLWKRLDAHAAGERGGDHLRDYVDFLVLGDLSVDQIERVAAGELRFDTLVRAFIGSELTYRYVTTEDGELAFALEQEVRRGALDCGRPHVNPM